MRVIRSEHIDATIRNDMIAKMQTLHSGYYKAFLHTFSFRKYDRENKAYITKTLGIVQHFKGEEQYKYYVITHALLEDIEGKQRPSETAISVAGTKYTEAEKQLLKDVIANEFYQTKSEDWFASETSYHIVCDLLNSVRPEEEKQDEKLTEFTVTVRGEKDFELKVKAETQEDAEDKAVEIMETQQPELDNFAAVEVRPK